MFLSSPYEKEFKEIFSHLAPETQQYLHLMAKELLKTQQKLLHQEDVESTALEGEEVGGVSPAGE